MKNVKKHLLVRLPWPPVQLSPNFRGHWAVVYPQKQVYRRAAKLRTQAAREYVATPIRPVDGVSMTVTAHPSINRKRDQDNFIARLKAGFDGIADALKVNDCTFVQKGVRFGERANPPFVEVDIEWEETEEVVSA